MGDIPDGAEGNKTDDEKPGGRAIIPPPAVD